MLVSDFITRVSEYVDNPMTASDDFTPTMLIAWLNRAVNHYWRRGQSQEWGYFQGREATITLVSGTSVYALPNASTTTATTSASVALISTMFLRQGSGAPYTYLKIEPTYPTERYFLKMSNLLFPVSSILTTNAGFTWSSSIGSLDGSGRPQWSIEFSPTPAINGTVVFDFYRYPAVAAATTDHIDLPDHVQEGAVLHVVRDCYFRDKADLSEIDKKIEKFDADIFAFETRGVQNDGPLIVREVR
jgi:hypothetical protein